MKRCQNAIVALTLWVAAGFATSCFGQATQPVIPDKAMAAPKTAATSPAPLLDINTASEEELRALKGVGDKRAADIIKNRPYKGKDELVQKKIIPAGVYAKIKNQIIAKQK